MAMGHECLPERGLTLVVWDGFVTSAAWRHQAMRIIADPHFPTPLVLGDMRTVTGNSLKKLDIFDNSSLLAARVPALPQKLALVTRPDAKELFETFRGSADGLLLEMQRFDDLSDACAWLGISREATEVSLEFLRSELGSRAAR